MGRRRKMKKVCLMGLIFAILIFLVNISYSQEGKPKMKTELIKLKYLRQSDMRVLLMSYISREGRITWSEDQNIISVMDVPEIVDKILSVLKEIDVKPVDLLFTVQLVLGSESGTEITDASLKDEPVIKELRGLLRYKNFTLLDTSLIRTMDKKLAATECGKDAEFMLAIMPNYTKEEKEEIIQAMVHLDQRIMIKQLSAQGNAENKFDSRRLIETTLTMKSGEKTVVGVSKMDGGDKGLILIISGKVIK
jgi:hypothetical protein